MYRSDRQCSEQSRVAIYTRVMRLHIIYIRGVSIENNPNDIGIKK